MGLANISQIMNFWIFEQASMYSSFKLLNVNGQLFIYECVDSGGVVKENKDVVCDIVLGLF